MYDRDTSRRIECIAIGASAGGVDALGVLLAALPQGLAATVVVVLHLPADKPSLLPMLLGRQCALPVSEADDKEMLKPGAVYLAPPGYHLLVEPGRSFALSCDAPVHYSRPSIDLLFESAAIAYGDALLAIILTGASADGAAGLQAVRQRGGLAWVQDPQEAQSDVMPRAAIDNAGADRVLRLQDMAALLAGHTGPGSSQPRKHS